MADTSDVSGLEVDVFALFQSSDEEDDDENFVRFTGLPNPVPARLIPLSDYSPTTDVELDNDREVGWTLWYSPVPHDMFHTHLDFKHEAKKLKLGAYSDEYKALQQEYSQKQPNKRARKQ